MPQFSSLNLCSLSLRGVHEIHEGLGRALAFVDNKKTKI